MEEKWLQPKEKQPAFHLNLSKDFYLFPILVFLQIGIYSLMLMNRVNFVSPTAEQLLDWGGLFRTSVIQDQEVWRIFTAIFLHAGIFHLLMNALKIWILGSLLEPALGRLQSFLVFIVGAIAANLVSLSWHASTVVVGSSGGAFALFGAFLVILIFRRSALKSWLAPFVLILILISVDLVFGSFQRNIDNAAHLGGFLTGLVLGGLCLPGLFDLGKHQLSNGLIGLLGLGLVIGTFILLQQLNDPVGNYRNTYADFVVQEDSAMLVFGLNDSLPDEHKREAFDAGLQNWKQAEATLDSLTLSELPACLQKRVSDLKLYAQLRYKQFDLIALYYATQEPMHFEEAQALDSQILKLRNGKNLEPRD